MLVACSILTDMANDLIVERGYRRKPVALSWRVALGNHYLQRATNQHLSII